MMTELVAEKRNAATRSARNAARANRKLPAVLYGPEQKPVSLVIDYHPFEKVLTVAGESTLVNVSFDGTSVPTLIKDIQIDPRTGKISHVDFFAVSMKKELDAHVDLEFVGSAPAVAKLGGTLVKVKDALKIRCLPKDLIRSIAVMTEKLATFDDVITVADLVIPAGITVEAEPDEVVAKVSAPLTEEQLQALEAENNADVSKVEVVGKKKEDEVVEGAEGAVASSAEAEAKKE